MRGGVEGTVDVGGDDEVGEDTGLSSERLSQRSALAYPTSVHTTHLFPVG